jgi:hypothetical protein
MVVLEEPGDGELVHGLVAAFGDVVEAADFADQLICDLAFLEVTTVFYGPAIGREAIKVFVGQDALLQGGRRQWRQFPGAPTHRAARRLRPLG